ncbi:hypothetical protein O6H91_24G007300 [Diphasiastrum complanatum]|nr:hypothetical protein O6H91_24G007300 [Diphasiastrum complanatum]
MTRRFKIKLLLPNIHTTNRHRLMSNVSPGSAAKNGSSQKSGSDYKGNKFFLPGASIATLMMLGALHARRLYYEKQTTDLIRQGKEPEFATDVKATFLQILPLRLISRTWGSLTSVEIPTWARSYVYKGWARAFKADLTNIERSLEDYPSLRDFFARGLKKGSRPLDPNPTCLLSPVDGIVMRCGEVREPGTKVDQIKGFSYSLPALLGAEPPPPRSPDVKLTASMQHTNRSGAHKTQWMPWLKFWSRADTTPDSSLNHLDTQLFYCVLYLGPGDYHRVHSPANWCIDVRRHFPGHLYPVNTRAVRTIKNLYVLNERVVLEGKWSQGFMSMALVGATNVGSIEVKFEPELKTNVPKYSFSSGSSLNIRVYGDKKSDICVNRGDEVAVFNMGSTVVLVFQAPGSTLKESEHVANGSVASLSRGFHFFVNNGQRVRVGQAIGRW